MKVLLIGGFPDFVIREIKRKVKLAHLERSERGKNQKEIENAEVMIITPKTKVDKKFLGKAKSLNVLITFSHGYDHVDEKTLRTRGVKFYTIPGSTPSVAELTFGLMISVLRKIPEQDRRMKRGEWKREFGYELFGKTLGVVGLGPIGRDVCRIAKVFGMKVIACDPNKMMKGRLAIKKVSLNTLLKGSDIVSLHAHLDRKTKHMIGGKELKKMKNSAILINIARGGLVDSKALYEALKSGSIVGAGLDVYEKEPVGRDRLVRLPNVVSMPHAGADTLEGEERKVRMLLDILKKEL